MDLRLLSQRRLLAADTRQPDFRPVVFFPHGLALAFFTALTLLASLVLVRLRTRTFHFPAGGVAGYFGVLLLFCKSLGPLAYAVLLGPIVLFTRPRCVGDDFDATLADGLRLSSAARQWLGANSNHLKGCQQYQPRSERIVPNAGRERRNAAGQGQPETCDRLGHVGPQPSIRSRRLAGTSR